MSVDEIQIPMQSDDGSDALLNGYKQEPNCVTNKKNNKKHFQLFFLFSQSFHQSCASEFIRAYENDDFEGFKKLLKARKNKSISVFLPNHRKDIFVSQSYAPLTDFERILCTDDKKTCKYISFVLKHHEVWNDKVFLESKNCEGKTLMHYVVQSDNVENLLSFLMFNWFQADDSTNSTNYSLVLKSEQYLKETGRQLHDKLYEILEDNSLKIYQNICVRIMYQHLHELDTDKALTDIEQLLDSKRVWHLNNQTVRVQIMQIFLVFLRANVEVFNNISLTQFFTLASPLKKREHIKFIRIFERYILEAKETYGTFYSTILKPDVRLLLKIAEREQMTKASAFVRRIFPFIEANSTFMSNFYEVQDFNVINILPFVTPELKDLVRKHFFLKYFDFFCIFRKYLSL